MSRECHRAPRTTRVTNNILLPRKTLGRKEIPHQHGQRVLLNSQIHISTIIAAITSNKIISSRKNQQILNSKIITLFKIIRAPRAPMRQMIKTRINLTWHRLQINPKVRNNSKATNNQIHWVFKMTEVRMMGRRTKRREIERRVN